MPKYTTRNFEPDLYAISFTVISNPRGAFLRFGLSLNDNGVFAIQTGKFAAIPSYFSIFSSARGKKFTLSHL